MALSKASSDEDRTRFFRLSLVILENLTPMLQDLLRREIRPSQIFDKVKQNTKDFQTAQLVRIKQAKVTNSNEDFDITLLYTLLRNYCPNIQPPTQGWGISNIPAQCETTEGDDIERIRLIRNKVIGHPPMPKISNTEFKEQWSIIYDICKRMQAKIPNTQYVKELEEAKERTIDSDIEDIFMDNIKKLAEDETTVKDLILKLIEDKGK